VTVPATNKTARRTGCAAVLTLVTERLTVNVHLGHTDAYQGAPPLFYETLWPTHKDVTGHYVGDELSQLIGIQWSLFSRTENNGKAATPICNQLLKFIVKHHVLLSRHPQNDDRVNPGRQVFK
jgi:hypothetical protein